MAITKKIVSFDDITESVAAERLGISTTELSLLLKGHNFLSSIVMSSMESVLDVQ